MKQGGVFVLLLIIGVFLGGCEALTMTPDAWLDPHRWDREALAKGSSNEVSLAKAEPVVLD